MRHREHDKEYLVPRLVTHRKDFLRLPPTTRIVYQTLCDLHAAFSSSSEETFFRSLTNLANDSGLHKVTVSTALHELERLGFIEIIPDYQRVGNKVRRQINHYRVKEFTDKNPRLFAVEWGLGFNEEEKLMFSDTGL